MPRLLSERPGIKFPRRLLSQQSCWPVPAQRMVGGPPGAGRRNSPPGEKGRGRSRLPRSGPGQSPGAAGEMDGAIAGEVDGTKTVPVSDFMATSASAVALPRT